MTAKTLCKLKAIVFGAGGGGQNFVDNQQDSYNFMAFSDNDTRKYCKSVKGLRVVAPQEITKINFDIIIIASMWVKEIYEQLTNLGINPDQLFIPPKNQLKDGTPFTCSATSLFATRTIHSITKQLKKHNINCFVDFGTLLGFVRDGRLLDWDDDVDLSVNEYDFENTIACIANDVYSVFQKKADRWQGFLVSDTDGNKYGLSLRFNQIKDEVETVKPFEIYLRSRRRKNGFSIPMGAVGNLFVPGRHFDNVTQINAVGFTFFAPDLYESYLDFVYGDWRVPKKNVDFTFYKPVDMTPFGKTDSSPLVKQRII